MRVFAIIPAAGAGARMKSGMNKQFAEIGGMPMLARTIAAFQRCASIDSIVISARSDEINRIRQDIVEKYGFDKVCSVTAGGRMRQDSVYCALTDIGANHSAERDDIVLIHDGARPLVSDAVLVRCKDAVMDLGAACTAVPANNTVKSADGDGFVTHTLDRDRLWMIQTPQGFRFGLISDCYARAFADGFYGTDDSVLVERAGYKVKLIMGAYDNIKVTTKEDLLIANALLSQ